MFQQVKNPSSVAPNPWEVPSGRVNLQGLVGNMNLYSSVEMEGSTGPTGPQGPTGLPGSNIPDGINFGNFPSWNGTEYVAAGNIAIGKIAGVTSQKVSSIAIRENAGNDDQGFSSIAPFCFVTVLF